MAVCRTPQRGFSLSTLAGSRRMLLRCVLAATVLVAAGCGPTTSTVGSASPSPALRPKVVSQNRLSAPGVTGTFDIVQQVVDYPPGSFSVQHTHAGPVLISVLDGEMSARAGSEDSKVPVGKSLAEMPGTVYQTGNGSTGPAAWVAAIFVPAGGAVSTPVVGAHPIGASVTPRFTYRWKGISQDGPYSLIQVVQDFDPGAWTQRHKHGGNGVITVIEGQITFRSNGHETVYKAGDSFIEQAGQVVEAGNVGTTRTRVAASFLIPQAAALTTVAN